MKWPAEVAARYRAEGYWLDRTLDHWVAEPAYPGKTALVSGEHRISYRELAGHVAELAGGLRAAGLRRGDRILVQLPNRWEFVVVLLACLRTGIAPVLALPAYRDNELAYLARHTGARMIVVPGTWRGFDHAAMATRIAGALEWPCRVAVCEDGPPDWLRAPSGPTERPDPDDVAFFLLSGGTTGTPKLIGRTHNDYDCHIRHTAPLAGIGPHTVYLAVLPAAHNFPLCPGILGTLAAGGTVVLAPSPEPAAAFALMAREHVTTTSVVPAVARRWVDAATASGPPAPGLRLVQVGGSMLEPDLARALPSALGCRLQQVLGMAEGLICYTRLDDPEDLVTGTQGRPVCPADEVRVVDDSDVDVPEGEIGELLTRGPYTTRGYFGAPEHNARAFTADGWYRTGDLVRRLPGGHLVVAGRRKDLINRAGEKVSAEEVEQLALDLLDLTAAAAVPLPDPAVGERVCLVVVPRGPAPALAEVRAAFLAHGVAHYKVPEQVEVLDALPLTAVGKVDKKVLRAGLVPS